MSDESPRRIQRQRTKGWRMPPGGAVYVGRPTQWGNPFYPGGYFMLGDSDPDVGFFRMAWGVTIPELGRKDPRFTLIPSKEIAVAWYEKLLAGWEAQRRRIKQELVGKDLVCWCPLSDPCHADVMLRIANA